MFGTDVTPFKLFLHVVAAGIGWSIAFWLRASYKRWAALACNSGHKKKFVRLTRWTNIDCKKHGRHTESEWWSTWATWMCEEPGCNTFGEDCFGTEGFWKIEFGKVLLDEKQMTDPQKGETPAQVAIRRKAREQGLPRAVNVNEAMKLLVDLAVQAKKGQIGPTNPPVPAEGLPDGKGK